MDAGLACPSCGQIAPVGAECCPHDGTTLALERTQIRDPIIGMMVGEYQITGVVGSGGFGTVYDGLQPLIGKRVAVKVLHGSFASDQKSLQRFVEEARAVNAIRHRGIVDIFGFGQLPDGRQYLVMELLNGQPLDKIIEESAPMTPAAVLPVMTDVVEALAAAHGAGVVHRDLKPGNIFLVTQSVGRPFAKLLDFGLAKQARLSSRHVSTTGVTQGTPEYMAPEQTLGEPVSAQTDLYALGILAFEMLTGRIPYEGRNAFETLQMHVQAPVPYVRDRVPNVLPALEEIVWRLMQKAPGDRPGSAREVGHMLSSANRDLHLSETRVWLYPPGSPEGIPEESPSKAGQQVGSPGAPSLGRGSPIASGTPSASSPARLVAARSLESVRLRLKSRAIQGGAAAAIAVLALGAWFARSRAAVSELAATPLAQAPAALQPSPAPELPATRELGAPPPSIPPRREHGSGAVTARARERPAPQPPYQGVKQPTSHGALPHFSGTLAKSTPPQPKAQSHAVVASAAPLPGETATPSLQERAEREYERCLAAFHRNGDRLNPSRQGIAQRLLNKAADDLRSGDPATLKNVMSDMGSFTDKFSELFERRSP